MGDEVWRGGARAVSRRRLGRHRNTSTGPQAARAGRQPRRRAAVPVVVAASLVLPAVLVAPASPAAAATPAPPSTFVYTGAPQLYFVPAGATSVRIEAWGAQGGGAGPDGAESGTGGYGGYTAATVTATPGDVLQVNVGGRGVSWTTTECAGAGWNGGGCPGAAYNPYYYSVSFGAGGGGASDVRLADGLLTSRLVVAGGGGGQPRDVVNQNPPPGLGGAGGPVGLPGYTDNSSGVSVVDVDGTTVQPDVWIYPRTDYGNPGLGATQVAGGTGGAAPLVLYGGYPGQDGSFGVGGRGGNGTWTAGGGGGGGYYGGGGGGSYGWNGGGGGSSYVTSLGIGAVFEAGVQAGHGRVVITPIYPPVTTGQPSPPRNVVAVTGADHVSASVSWQAPADDGGAPILRYRVQAWDVTTGGWGPAAQECVACTSATVAGLTQFHRYWIAVTAINALTAQSAAQSNEIQLGTASPPSPPLNVTATARPDNTSADVTWSPPADDHGSPVTRYTLTVSSTDGGAQPAGPSCNAPCGSAVATGLTPAKTYFFTVTAYNAVGSSSAVSNTMRTGGTPPSPPRNVTASPGDGTADVVWDLPASAGTSPITGYSINIWTANGSPAGTGPSCGANCLGAEVTGLTNGQSYYFSVVAHTADGSSAANSNTVTPVFMSGAAADGPCTYGAYDPSVGCNNGTIVRVYANSSSQATDIDGWHVQLTAAGGMQVPTRCADDYGRPFYRATATPSCPMAGGNVRPVQIVATVEPWRSRGDFVAIGYVAGCINYVCSDVNPSNGGVYKVPYVDGSVNGEYFVGMYKGLRISSPEEHQFEIRRDRAAGQWRFLYDNASLTGMDGLINAVFNQGRVNAGTESAVNRKVAINHDQQYGSHMAFRSSSGTGYVAPGWLQSFADGGCSITYDWDGTLGAYFRSSGSC